MSRPCGEKQINNKSPLKILKCGSAEDFFMSSQGKGGINLEVIR